MKGRRYSLEMNNSSILTSCGIFVYIMCNLAYSLELCVFLATKVLETEM